MPGWGRRSFLRHVGGGAVAAAACSRRRPAATDTPVVGAEGPAELLIRGGTIMTMDPARPRAEALAISGGVVVAVGERARVEARTTASTQVIDLDGGLATPGLTDAHAHLVGLGKSLEAVDLRGATSAADVVARLQAADPPGRWVLGRGWDQNLWPGTAMPTREILDAAFGSRPVWLRRVDGHAGWANGAALEQAGIGPDTATPAGGEILRNPNGTPTGVLIDAAMDLMTTPAPSGQDIRRWIARASAHAVQRGITGVHEMGISAGEDRIYRALAGPARDQLGLRVTAYAAESWFTAALREHGRPDVPTPTSRYDLVGVKIYADGALGSRGAALLAPYHDRPEHHGLMQHDAAQLEALARAAMASGFQAATHAIGDAANRAVLDAYQLAFATGDRPDPRFRIEHCQVLAPQDIPRFAELNVIASMQPTHATSDMAWVPARIGADRVAGAYAWRRLLDAGTVVCFGSDFPVEKVDITHGLHAAITRQTADGQPPGGWLADQTLDLDQAVHAFTVAAAHAVHREHHLGMLAPGMQADVTCFVEDLQTVPTVHDATVRATVVGGSVAFLGD